jgi:dimethylargininase
MNHAIVRCPCPELVRGITTANLGEPDYDLALQQHYSYIKALESCGLTVTVLPSDSRFPDSVFIEDVALCTPRCAVVTRPGAPTRRDETDGIHAVLESFFESVEEITAPGTVEAGDIMMVGDHFYIGISERTNLPGAAQLIGILNKYGLTGSTVPLRTMLHLKTGVNYLDKNTLLITGELLSHSTFQHFNRIEVDPEEAYAANSLFINGTVLVPAGFPKTRHKIESAGYPVLPVDVSEFRKLDGGLSCLSLRF